MPSGIEQLLVLSVGLGKRFLNITLFSLLLSSISYICYAQVRQVVGHVADCLERSIVNGKSGFESP